MGLEKILIKKKVSVIYHYSDTTISFPPLTTHQKLLLLPWGDLSYTL